MEPKDIIEVIQASPILQIFIGLSCLLVAGLLTVLVVIIAKRGLKIGPLQIRGLDKPKQDGGDADMLTIKARDESRTIVQEGIQAFCEYIGKLAVDVICGKAKAGCQHPAAEHEMTLILESLNLYLVRQTMQSVQRNHYAELNKEEWEFISTDLFQRNFYGAESYIEDRFKSEDVKITDIREVIENKLNEFKKIHTSMAERVRQISVRLLAKKKTIEGEAGLKLESAKNDGA